MLWFNMTNNSGVNNTLVNITVDQSGTAGGVGNITFVRILNETGHTVNETQPPFPVVVGLHANITKPRNFTLQFELNSSASNGVTIQANVTNIGAEQNVTYSPNSFNSSITTIDSKKPTVSFNTTTTNPGNYSQSYILANVTAHDDNAGIDTVTAYLYNTTSLVRNITTSSSLNYYNFSSLEDGTYYLNATANDTVGNRNKTATRTIMLDTGEPTVNFGTPTTSVGNHSQTWIEANITASDPNLDTITTYLYNTTSLVRNITTSSSLNYYNFSSLEDGTYYLNATANDTSGNVDKTTIRTILLDTTLPAITFSCDSTSVYVDDTITCSCNASDNMDSNVAVSYTANPSTSSTGSYTTTCVATDNANNNATSSISYTVNSETLVSVGMVNITPKQIHRWDVMDKDVVNKMMISNVEIGFRQINVKVKNSVEDVKITVTKETGKPTSVTQELTGKVYQYLSVDTRNLEDENIDEAVIKFRVKKSWLTQNNYQKEEVVLNRYNNGWNEINTNYESEDDNYYYYNASVPGFSVFGINARGIPETTTTTTSITTTTTSSTTTTQKVTTTTTKPLQKPYIGMVVLAVIIVLIIIGGIVYYKL